MCNWHELNRSTNEIITCLKICKKNPVPSLLPNVDLSIKKMLVFISSTRSI